MEKVNVVKHGDITNDRWERKVREIYENENLMKVYLEWCADCVQTEEKEGDDDDVGRLGRKFSTKENGCSVGMGMQLKSRAKGMVIRGKSVITSSKFSTFWTETFFIEINTTMRQVYSVNFQVIMQNDTLKDLWRVSYFHHFFPYFSGLPRKARHLENKARVFIAAKL